MFGLLSARRTKRHRQEEVVGSSRHISFRHHPGRRGKACLEMVIQGSGDDDRHDGG